MPERYSTERIANQVVKASMSRVRITVVALFPVLWLLAGQSLLEPGTDCAAVGIFHSNPALDSSELWPASPHLSTDISTRVVHSRSGKISGKTTPLPFEFLSRLQSARAFAAALSSQFPSPPALATSWQFACRAALEPRAPTSVS